MNPVKRSLAAVFILFSFLILSITACGGGGGGAGTDPDPNPPPSGTSFDSGRIADGETFSYTFENEGTFAYFCQIHAPDMQGSVTVSSDADISGEYTIVMKNIAFNPSSVTITPETTIIWENQDGVTHDIKSGNPNNSGGPPY